ASFHGGFGQQSQFRATGNIVPQDVPGGDMRNFVILRYKLRLGTLACSRGAQKNDCNLAQASIHELAPESTSLASACLLSMRAAQPLTRYDQFLRPRILPLRGVNPS